MNKLQALAPLLSRLFSDAEASTARLRAASAALSDEERQAVMKRMQSDWRGFYGETAKDLHLAVSPATGTLLYMLARSARARAIVEFGTSFGVSTIHLAAALHDNGGGRLVTSEFEPTKVARARANIAEAGLAELVEVRAGDALETLARDLPDAIDLVLLDGAKSLYPTVLELVRPRLRPGAIVVADNADMSPEYLAIVRAEGWLSLPFDGDVEISMLAA